MTKAVFLDRDGVINYDVGYPHKLEHLRLIEGVDTALLNLQNAGFELFIVSNQSGVGRGYFDKIAVESFNSSLLRKLEKKGIGIKDIKYCPHVPADNCSCRKPEPGMILSLLNRYNLDPFSSFMVGDKKTDIAAGQKAGLKKNFKIKTNVPNALSEVSNLIMSKF